MKPIFSIIIPAYNAAKTIELTLDSLLRQDFQNWEAIVVENGSTDETNQIVEKYIYDSRIQLIHSKKGVSYARNKGIDSAQGNWILFLDADDELIEDALSNLENVQNDEIDIIIGQYDGQEKDKNCIIENKDYYLCACLNDPTQKCNSTGLIFKRALLIENHLYFDVQLSHAEDSLFFINAILCSRKLIEIKNAIYKVNYVNNSTVRSNNLNQFDSYIRTIKRIYELKKMNIAVYNEISAFTLNQVLIVLVNNVFTKNNGKSFSELVQVEKKILEEDIVIKALNNISYLYCDKKRKILFKLMQHNHFVLLGIVCSLKHELNQRKMRRL